MRRLALALVVPLFATCASAPNPFVPPVEITPLGPTVHCPECMEFPPPDVYRRWWGNIERCSGFAGTMDTLRFFVAPKPILAFTDTGPRFLAYYFGGHHPAVIFGLSEEGDSTVVEHEMLHALIEQNHVGIPGVPHPITEQEKCGAQLKNWWP